MGNNKVLKSLNELHRKKFSNSMVGICYFSAPEKLHFPTMECCKAFHGKFWGGLLIFHGWKLAIFGSDFYESNV